MGDTDVNVYLEQRPAHYMGGALVEPGGFVVRFHLASQSLDATLHLSPVLSHALLAVAIQVGSDAWPNAVRPGQTERANLVAVSEVLQRHPSWFGIEQSLGAPLKQSALKSLVMALRYPLG